MGNGTAGARVFEGVFFFFFISLAVVRNISFSGRQLLLSVLV